VRIPLFARLYGSFALIVLLSTGVVWWIASVRVQDQALATLGDVLETRTALLEHAGIDPSLKDDQGLAHIGPATGTRFTLIAADGAVTADSEEDPAHMENHAKRPEIVAAGATGKPATSTRFSRTVGRDLMYLARPVFVDSRLTGYIRAAVPLLMVDERLAELRANVAIGAATSLALALVLGVILTRRFTRPLAEMTRAATEMANGKHQRIRAIETHDEMGQLARALESMSVQLDERLQSLSRERNQLRAVLASMLEGVVAVDGDERVVHLNHVAAGLLGTTAVDATGQRFWELVRVKEIGDLLKEVLSESGDRTREISLPGPPRERLIQVHASPLRGPDDEIAGAVMVLFDVTELRHLEMVRREFVANVSHELKTPLTAIRGFIETILDDQEVDDATKRRFLGRALDQSLRISALVNDLLVLSRVESEQEALERVHLDLRDPLAESARRVFPDLSGRHLTFETQLPEAPVPVTGDEEALRQAVDNLLDNAFKYTPDGGTVRLELKVAGDFAVIRVSDTGIGIDVLHQARVFERFYRVDKARSRELGGTGLGLSIVKHIAEAHRGAVSVSSVPGDGCVFEIRVPLHIV